MAREAQKPEERVEIARPVRRGFDFSAEGRILSSFSDETLKMIGEQTGLELIPRMVTDIRGRLIKRPDECAVHIQWSLSW